mgnify:CR=1 FL=1
MNNKSILVTGGYGFIGSNFINFLLEKYQDYNIVNLDSLTYAADKKNIYQANLDSRYLFIRGDICDKDLIKKIFHDNDITDVIHFAAESHVDNSISSPDVFIKTNINGTFNLLNHAYKFWMKKPFTFRSQYQNSRFLHVSTDEVYGSLGEEGLFTETTPYAPNSPYSASKASSDMLVRSYNETYGLNTIITNCSNNYGPNQHNEKLIPKIIFNALNGKEIPIYGNGLNIRDWLYVEDHCKAIDTAFHKGASGNVYNIGGDNEKTNIYIAKLICEILDKKMPSSQSYKELITFVEDRHGHDWRYAIDFSKIKNKLGWMPDETFESGIDKTIDWYLKKFNE